MSTVKRSLNVGVIGMGNMGIPIARNLAFKSRSSMYLQIHSRTLSKARRVCDDLSADGATCAMRIHDRYSTMTKWCDVILLALSDVRASRHALLEDREALLLHARPGQLIVDHTTVDVATSRACAAAAENRGAQFLDAPMSGGARAVANGSLALFVGGAADAFQRLLPIFHFYADAAHHVGGSGGGSAAKLISAALAASHSAAAGEAARLAERLGVNFVNNARLVEALELSDGASAMLRRNAPLLRELIRDPARAPPTSAASVDRMLADLAMLDASLRKQSGGGIVAGEREIEREEEIEEEEEPLPVLDAALRGLAAASDAGMGDRDLAAAVHFSHAAMPAEAKKAPKKAEEAPVEYGEEDFY